MSAKRRKTRRTKQFYNEEFQPNPKYTDSFGINSFNLTKSQQELNDKIENHDIIFVEAPAGTGKSFAAAYYAVKDYLVSRNNIVIIRTPVEAGADKVGFLPAGLQEKLEPHFCSIKKILDSLLSKGKVDIELDKTIFFRIPNFCLGETFTNSVVIVDEAQELSPLILKLLLERIGDNTKMIILGDPSQLYSYSKNGRNGLTSAMKRFFETDESKALIRDNYGDLIPKYENKIAYHKFSIEDVVRSDIVKTVLTAYTKNPL